MVNELDFNRKKGIKKPEENVRENHSTPDYL